MEVDGSTTPELWVDVVAPDACVLVTARAPAGLVAVGLVLAELDSDKATMEVPSPVDGELVWLRRAGETLRRGDVIARVRRCEVPARLHALVAVERARQAPARTDRAQRALAGVGVVAGLVPAGGSVVGTLSLAPSPALSLFAVVVIALASGLVAARWPSRPWVAVPVVGVGALSLWAGTVTSPGWLAGLVALWVVASLTTWRLDRPLNPPAHHPPSAPSA